MRSLLASLSIVMFCLVSIPDATAGSAWGPDFSGEWNIVNLKHPNKVKKATIYASHGRTAMERRIPKKGWKKYGKRVVDIMDPVKGVQIRFYPDVKKYMMRKVKVPKKALRGPPPGPGDKGHPCQSGKSRKTKKNKKVTMTCRLLGKETVNGRRTEKWELVMKRDGKKARIIQWYDPQLHIAIKEEIPGKMSRELKRLRIGKLPDSVFQVPKGYKKITPPKKKKVHKTED